MKAIPNLTLTLALNGHVTITLDLKYLILVGTPIAATLFCLNYGMAYSQASMLP